MQSSVRRDGNQIQVVGRFDGSDLRRILGAVHHIIRKLEYKDVILDFRRADALFESGVLPLIPILRKYRVSDNVDFILRLPGDPRMARLFRNSGWDHWIDPLRFPHVPDDSGNHVAVRQFSTADEQYAVVDVLVERLSRHTQLTQDQMQALEWSLNEITDNVLNHAQSRVGGFVQSTYYGQSQAVELMVADAGIGIPSSLGIKDHQHAIERAMQEGVTRDRKTNQGNGLFGVYRIALVANGRFEIQSSLGHVYLDEGSVKFRDEATPYSGTFVRWSISLKSEKIISQALKFQGRAHSIVYDYYDKLLNEGGGRIVMRMKKEFSSFRSRQAGKGAYTKIRNLLNWGSTQGLELDFSEISIISSSFADEVFGRLFVELGPIVFMNRVHLINAPGEIPGIIDQAMTKRFVEDKK